MEKIYLGHVAVDSGQLMVTDPSYVRDFDSNNFEDVRIYHDTKTQKDYQFGVDFQNYEEELIDGKTVNDLLAEGRLNQVASPPDNSYSYNGACHTTLNEDGGGMLQHNGMYLGVAFSSGYGDGRYPVYGYMNEDQRITKVEILMD